jgi:EAL domain-containing protein (putative c-di-GMP-specific phosphodiesterase class I)
MDADDQGGRKPSLVAAIVSMATALGMQTVAEGVETEAQAEALADLGCALGQGYLFARPASSSAIRELVTNGGGRLG